MSVKYEQYFHRLWKCNHVSSELMKLKRWLLSSRSALLHKYVFPVPSSNPIPLFSINIWHVGLPFLGPILAKTINNIIHAEMEASFTNLVAILKTFDALIILSDPRNAIFWTGTEFWIVSTNYWSVILLTATFLSFRRPLPMRLQNQSVHVLLPPPLSPLILHPPHLFIHQQVFIGRAHATRRGTSPGW